MSNALISGSFPAKPGAVIAPVISYEKYKARRSAFRSPPVEDDYVPKLKAGEAIGRLMPGRKLYRD